MMKLLKKYLWFCVNALAKKASRNYVAGPLQVDAQHTSEYLSSLGYWITQGFWDGADDSSDKILENYLVSMSELTKIGGDNYISIKIPSLNYDTKMYQRILSRSKELGIPIHFDSLAPEQADKIHSFIIDNTDSQYDDVGFTLPGRWRRSIKDAELANHLGINVRVVKGQWIDPDEPNRDANKGYMQVINKLAGKAKCVRVATHDISLAKQALIHLKKKNTYCELELLYGLPVKRLITLAESLEVPVRIYVAFGHAYLPYALSSIRKNPGMLFLLMKEIFKGNYLSSFTSFSSSDTASR